MRLEVGAPYIRRVGDRSRLSADLRLGEKGTTLWYEVDARYEKYLCVERADPFFALLVPLSQSMNVDISFAGAVSERLYYQMLWYLMPSLARAVRKMHQIRVDAPVAAGTLPSSNAVGTGFSGGADSLYTILRHTGADAPKSYRLTHLAVFKVSSSSDYEPRDYLNTLQNARDVARELGLNCIAINSNLQQMLTDRYFPGDSPSRASWFVFRNMSTALAVQKLFSVYYHSSAYPFEEMVSFDDYQGAGDNASIELLLDQCLSTDALRFYAPGGETTRVGKLIALSEWEPSRRWLHACYRPGERHCGRCRKCMQALAVFDAIGKLDDYRGLFDVEDYLRRRDQVIGALLGENEDDYMYASTVALLEGVPGFITPAARAHARKLRSVLKVASAFVRREPDAAMQMLNTAQERQGDA